MQFLDTECPAALLGDLQLRSLFAQGKVVLAVIDILFYFDFRVVIQREVTCYRRRANSLFTATDNTAAKTIQSR